MIINKISKSNLSLKYKLKNALTYISRVRWARKSWDKRHKSILNVNPEYNKPCDRNLEKKHSDLWGPFRKNCDITTLRICKNISGNADERIIPEDIFVSDIEPSLNKESNVDFLSNKSFYNRWFEEGIFPRDYAHRIDGDYFNNELEKIPEKKFRTLAEHIEYPVVLKPNRDAYGGQDIFFAENDKDLLQKIKGLDDFVVQEKIEQYQFFKELNPSGLNTIRVYLYRSVLDNSLHILTMALRMGKDGSLDNETAGGIHTMIKSNGVLNGYAVDKFGTKYFEHPNTKVTFDKKIPDYESLKEMALKIGTQVFLTRIIGLDMCRDIDGSWRAIEINTKGHSIRFSQYGGVPFFGEFTEEVIQYCIENHWALKA